ncbi:hypothetical protein TWF730_004568 [Orbilia blumenaviensis]|uniref:Uncharacterized protein n=1 Tax=Orbilia blumenaviensis TaxID=1796055 RepID=A0AAV9U156_9PEZI
MESSASNFMNSFRNISRDPRTEIVGLLSSELPRAAEKVATVRPREFTGDLLTDSGDFITYLLDLLDEVATGISEGKSMKHYLKRQLKDDDAIDLDYSHHLSERRAALLSICRKLKKTSIDIRNIWDDTLLRTEETFTPDFPHSHTLSPGHRKSSVSQGSHSQESPFGSSAYSATGELRQSFNHPDSFFRNPPPAASHRRWRTPQESPNIEDFGDLEEEDEEEEEEEEDDSPEFYETFDDMDLDRSGTAYLIRRGPSSVSTSLSSPGADIGRDFDKRGTGSYTCPHEWKCKKGGVNEDRLVVFIRNSDFK